MSDRQSPTELVSSTFHILPINSSYTYFEYRNKPEATFRSLFTMDQFDDFKLPRGDSTSSPESIAEAR